MSIEIKVGELADFFESAKETARSIDAGKTPARKNRIWVDAADVAELLKPSRIQLVHYLRKKKRATVKELVKATHRTSVTLGRDLDLLTRCQLVRTYEEKNPGHGRRKVVEPTFGSQHIELTTSI